MLYAFTATTLVCLVCGRDAVASDGRALIPDGEERATAVALVEEVYGDDCRRAKTDSQKAAMAERLERKAVQSESDIAVRYVMLTMANELALQAGDIEKAISVINRLDKWYQVDGLELKIAAIQKASKSNAAKSPKVIAECALAVLGEAVNLDRWDAINDLIDSALRSARIANDTSLMRRVLACKSEIAERAKAFADYQDAILFLKHNDSDPAANMKAGRYLCFCKENWNDGLPMLAKCGDSLLEDVVDLELKGASSADQQAELADAWWNLANKRHGMDKVYMQRRAAKWYAEALPSLSGLRKDQVAQRINDVSPCQCCAASSSGLWMFAGTWSVTYSNGVGRRYVIDKEGIAAYGDRRGRLSIKDGNTVLDFGDGKLERLLLVSGRLRIEHFNPASSYPSNPTATAEAEKITKQPENRRGYREFYGAWTIKYSNRATRVYLIDNSGNVAFPGEHLKGQLITRDGEVLLDFGNGQLERLEIADSLLRVEHYSPSKMYPHDFQLFGIGTKKQ